MKLRGQHALPILVMVLAFGALAAAQAKQPAKSSAAKTKKTKTAN